MITPRTARSMKRKPKYRAHLVGLFGGSCWYELSTKLGGTWRKVCTMKGAPLQFETRAYAESYGAEIEWDT